MSGEAPVKRLHQALLKHIDNCEETDKSITELRCIVEEQQQEIDDGVRELVSTIGSNLRRGKQTTASDLNLGSAGYTSRYDSLGIQFQLLFDYVERELDSTINIYPALSPTMFFPGSLFDLYFDIS